MSLIVVLTNDGTGKNDLGNYDCSVWVNNKPLWTGRIEGHNRRTGWEVLLGRLADSIMDGKGERKRA